MRILVCGGLVIAIFATAIGIVLARHQSRRQFIELQALEQQRDKMSDEWHQLLLDQAQWGMPDRVQDTAKRDLGMRVPSADAVTAVRR
jgi:cell division protein FtsL